MNWLSRLALLLVIIGALNWLLVGLFQWDLVASVFGGETMRASSMLARIVYTLVGVAGLYCLTFLFGGAGSERSSRPELSRLYSAFICQLPESLGPGRGFCCIEGGIITPGKGKGGCHVQGNRCTAYPS